MSRSHGSWSHAVATLHIIAAGCSQNVRPGTFDPVVDVPITAERPAPIDVVTSADESTLVDRDGLVAETDVRLQVDIERSDVANDAGPGSDRDDVTVADGNVGVEAALEDAGSDRPIVDSDVSPDTLPSSDVLGNLDTASSDTDMTVDIPGRLDVIEMFDAGARDAEPATDSPRVTPSGARTLRRSLPLRPVYLPQNSDGVLRTHPVAAPSGLSIGRRYICVG